MKRRAPISEAELRRAETGRDPDVAELARLIREAIALLTARLRKDREQAGVG